MKTSYLKKISRDSGILTALAVIISLAGSLVMGQFPLSHLLVGVAVAFGAMILIHLYSILADLNEVLGRMGIEIENIKIATQDDLRIISMGDFVAQESALRSGDSVLVFASKLEYDRKFFADVIAENLNRGVRYYYLMGGATAKRDWELFLDELRAKGAKCFPVGKFNTPNVVPLVWTTAIYEFGEGEPRVHAISILEHIYESKACIELSQAIARRVQEHFWAFWDSLDNVEAGQG